MSFVLQQDGYIGWFGPTDATVTLEARVTGDSELVAVRYASQNVTFTSIDDQTWGIELKIVAGPHRAFFTFFSPGPDDIDIVEIAALPVERPAVAVVPAEHDEQEIAGATHAVSPTLAPQIEGR